MTRKTIRRSRRLRYCENVGCQTRVIAVGDRYLEAVASPDHDGLGNVKWWRITECEPCARARGGWPESEAA